jgi:hypothetical protein
MLIHSFVGHKSKAVRAPSHRGVYNKHNKKNFQFLSAFFFNISASFFLMCDLMCRCFLCAQIEVMIKTFLSSQLSGAALGFATKHKNKQTIEARGEEEKEKPDRLKKFS